MSIYEFLELLSKVWSRKAVIVKIIQKVLSDENSPG